MLNPFGEIKKHVDEQVKRAYDFGYDKGFRTGIELGAALEEMNWTHKGVILGHKFKSVEELMGGK